MFTTQSGEAGTFSAKATINAATAKRLGLGKRAVTIGTGKVKLAQPGSAKLKVRFTRKAVARLKKQRKPSRSTSGSRSRAPRAPHRRTVPLKLKR